MPRNTTAAAAFTRNLFTKTLWDNRRVLTVWVIATSLTAMMYAGFYPQVSRYSVPRMPPAMRGFNLADVSSASGYLQGPVFGLLLPLLATFYGAATGSRLISADEETGYLDLLLACPLGRTRLVWDRFAALAVGAAAMAVMVLAAMLSIRNAAGLASISVIQFTAQCVSLALLAIAFGAVAIALSGAFGWGRARVFGTTAGLGVLTYALHGFAFQISAKWLRYVAIYHYYIGGEPLKNGFQLGHIGILIAITAVLIAIGTWALNHRDLGI